MSFSGFVPINKPDNVRKTAGRPTESPNLRRSTRQERKELDKATALAPSINPGYLRLREQHGQEEALNMLINQQTSLEAKCAVAAQILDTVQNVTEEIGEVEEAMWERVIEKHQLWEPMGGKKWVKEMMEYDSQAGVRIRERQKEGGRKRRAREELGGIWGEGWEEIFDPEQRLKTASEHTLRNLAARAREGWKMEVVQRSIDDAFRARIMDRRQGVTMRPVFTKKDTEDGDKSLGRAETETRKRKEDVTLEDLEQTLSGVPSRRRLIDVGTASPQKERRPQLKPPAFPPRPPSKNPSRPARPAPRKNQARAPASSPSSSSSSPDSVIVIDDPTAHPGRTVAWDFDRRCFFYAQPDDAKRVDAEGTMSLARQGYTVEQFDLEWPSEVAASPGPIRRRRRVRTPPSEIRRSARVRRLPGDGPMAGSVFLPTSS